MIRIEDIDKAVRDKIQEFFGIKGFTEVGKRKWLRKRENGVFDLITINALKGGSFTPAWGLGIEELLVFINTRLKSQTKDQNKGMNLKARL